MFSKYGELGEFTKELKSRVPKGYVDKLGSNADLEHSTFVPSLRKLIGCETQNGLRIKG